MTGVPDPVRSGQNVLRDPPPDLDLALGQHEVGPVPDESVFHKKKYLGKVDLVAWFGN